MKNMKNKNLSNNKILSNNRFNKNYNYKKYDDLNDLIVYLNINSVYPNPYQSRNFFDESALNELALSIKKYGVLEPIIVRYIKGNIYEIISGERRLKACKRIGLDIIPCRLIKASSKECACIALIENIQTENLNFIEEAEGLQNLMVNFGYSQDELSRIIGKNTLQIYSKLSILKLNKLIKRTLIDFNLSESYALELLKLNIDDIDTQLEVIYKIVEYDLNIEETSLLISNTLRENSVLKVFKPTQKIKGYMSDIKIFTNTITNAVDTIKQCGINTSYIIEQSEKEYEIKIKIKI